VQTPAIFVIWKFNMAVPEHTKPLVFKKKKKTKQNNTHRQMTTRLSRRSVPRMSAREGLVEFKMSSTHLKGNQAHTVHVMREFKILGKVQSVCRRDITVRLRDEVSNGSPVIHLPSDLEIVHGDGVAWKPQAA
jgi:hypothetical protein